MSLSSVSNVRVTYLPRVEMAKDASDSWATGMLFVAKNTLTVLSFLTWADLCLQGPSAHDLGR